MIYKAIWNKGEYIEVPERNDYVALVASLFELDDLLASLSSTANDDNIMTQEEEDRAVAERLVKLESGIQKFERSSERIRDKVRKVLKLFEEKR